MARRRPTDFWPLTSPGQTRIDSGRARLRGGKGGVEQLLSQAWHDGVDEGPHFQRQPILTRIDQVHGPRRGFERLQDHDESGNRRIGYS
jgi:hypothetical protein